MTPRKMNLALKITAGLVIVASLVFLYFANNRLSNIAKETASLKAQIEVSDNQLQIYEVTKKRVESLSYVEGLANQVLPATEDQSVIVAEITQFARNSNLQIGEINFIEGQAAGSKKAAPISGVKVTAFTIQIGGGATFENLLSFLRAIEGNRRKSQVTSINISPDSNSPGSLSNVTISLNLYTRTGATQ